MYWWRATARVTSARPGVAASPWAAQIVERLGVRGELARVLQIRMQELVAYQDEAYAQRYAQDVGKLLAARPADEAFALAVARNLYKLMAYKDEYEVARLHLDAEAQAALARNFGAGTRVYWHFQPTFLRALGVRNKIKVGGWFRPVLQLLRSLKAVRGGSFDLLGRTRLRRIERELPGHYLALLDAALARPGATPEQLLELAQGPDVIRGYEDVKMGNVAIYLTQVEGLQQRLGIAVTAPAALAAVEHEPAAAELKAA